MKKIFAIISILVFLCLLSSCAGALHSAAAKGDTKAIKEMLDSGADINDINIAASVWGTPLHFASKDCQAGAVKLLLEKGVSVNIAAGHVQWTALRFAAENGCNAVVNLLLDKGAEIDTRDRYGGTPLMSAANKGQISTVRLLVERGADTDYAIGRLLANKQTSASQLIETAAKSVRESKTQIATSRTPVQSTKDKSLSVETMPSKELTSIVKSDVDTLPPAKTRINKNAYAIVIGIESYRQKLPKADYAVADAKIISEYLTKTMGYPEENVITLLNDRALKSDMEKYFDRWLANNVEDNGRVFIYYSGHGAPNAKTGDAYLVPYDGDPTFIAETGYSIARLYESLGKLKAREITVILDSCFSGAGGRSVLAKGVKPLVVMINTPNIQKNISVMSASSGDQVSSAYEEKGHGLFTYYLLKGIKYEDVVRPDGSIKMDDLFGYIKPQVERIARKQFNNEQTPQLIGAKKN